MTPFAVLAHLKATLATVPGVTTCQIGLEANITPADYPLIRIVPTRITLPAEGSARRAFEVQVYFGAALLEASDGLEAVYASLLALDDAIREALVIAAVRTAHDLGEFLRVAYRETVTDEDRLPHYKLMAARFEVEG